MNTIIACGLAEKVGQNKYSLNVEGRKADVIGIKKYANGLKDKNRRDLIYHSFGLSRSWYYFPLLKMSIERIINSTISKEIWFTVRGVIILLIAYSIWAIYGDFFKSLL
ncbi:hypothetical protein PP182_19235 [Maribacter sp. PR1]|uniref:Uncharacterized protein n=1 Tax=Maribacter cobaltidurans TaxID=1178778 RepID=A0ABU7IZ03_9FLAO|nr:MULTISPECIES: hypothetical protein [Maribacter]MDC6390828.1 hypothetical protein [Maribacter sp. PR1]MEE1978220.1 hypothetical protein [Maribacter cobaltidurans]